MPKLHNKIVLITGASSGIGAACATYFAAEGAHLILTARRLDRLETLAQQLKNTHPDIDIVTLQLDIRDRDAIHQAIHTLPEQWKAIDLLINNAGLAVSSNLMQNAQLEDWDIMIDTNLRGLLYMTHAVLPIMISRNQGHIINIGSVAGHDCYPGGNVYSATKHAVRAITTSLRLDLLGKAIRVSEVDPGAVETEFSEVRWQDKARAKAFYADFTPLVANDIADAVLYCATRPPHVNIAEMIVYPTDQATINHIDRKNKEIDKA